MSKMSWYNFDIGDYECIETPEDFTPYLPEGAARSLYRLYIDHEEYSPAMAALEVLARWLGRENE